jgi:hypothetical protein
MQQLWLPVLADSFADALTTLAHVGQALAAILTGLIAVLGVPLALRQILNVQRELRHYERERLRKLDAEANLNIAARYSLTHAAPPEQLEPPHQPHHKAPQTSGAPAAPPDRPPRPGRRLLRLDLTMENVGEGTVDVLACLVAARELERLGQDTVEDGRDAQWSDLTRHYWNAGDDCFSPGLSTTKHIVYAPDALARIKSHSHKTLARVDQVRDFSDQVYLLYRAFVVARRASSAAGDLAQWTMLQRALLNVNAPSFREASAEEDPLGLVANADGWRLFLHHFEPLADPKLPQLRRQADREQAAITHDPAEYARTRDRLDAELQDYCRRNLLPAWRAFRADLATMTQSPRGFAALLDNRGFRQRQKDVERRFPWAGQEVWVEFFYITLEAA